MVYKKQKKKNYISELLKGGAGVKLIWGRHDAQHNDNQHNNEKWDTQHKSKKCSTKLNIMLSAAVEAHYADCRYADCHYAD